MALDENGRSAWREALRRRLRTFIGPAFVIPLGDPLMSVVDTICIGQFAGTGELAAMAPALIIFAFAQYIFQALQIATIRWEVQAVTSLELGALWLVQPALWLVQCALCAVVKRVQIRQPLLLPPKWAQQPPPAPSPHLPRCRSNAV